MKLNTLVFAIAAVYGLSTQALAQNTESALPEQATSQTMSQATNTPERGMSKDEVVKRYGKPKAWRGPIGQPPITVWDYGPFSVYFEYNTVLHAVSIQP